MSDIIYVDDELDLLTSATGDQKSRFVEIKYPEAVAGASEAEVFKAARVAPLWVFDFFLNDEADELSENGLSLFHRWRGALNRNHPAVAVVSNDLPNVLGDPLGPTERFHIHAETLGVEWVADKNAPDVVSKLIQLAEASRRLAAAVPHTVPQDASSVAKSGLGIDIGELCFGLLSAPNDADWSTAVERQVDKARPPRVGPPFGGVGGARLLLAWLLHRILPYPSFLLTESHSAIRLGITRESFARIAKGSKLAEKIASAKYVGPLADFHGSRWWRAGIDDVVWQISQSFPDYEAGLREWAGDSVLSFLASSYRVPVIVSNSDLVETDEIAEADDCVRATDEDFPSDVEPAWVLKSEVSHNRELRAKVIFVDRDEIEVGDDR